MPEHVIKKELNAELMLYDSEEDAVYILNPTARRVYELARKGKTVEEMTACIGREFQLETEKDITADVRACFQELQEKNLL
jgi:hypothetical protein